MLHLFTTIICYFKELRIYSFAIKLVRLIWRIFLVTVYLKKDGMDREYTFLDCRKLARLLKEKLIRGGHC